MNSHKRLHATEQQLELAREIDTPLSSGTPRNRGEKDITYVTKDGQTFIYKAWMSQRNPGNYYVYSATRQNVRRITKTAYLHLVNGTLFQGDNKSLDNLLNESSSLIDWLEPIKQPNWNFPVINDSLKLSTPKVRVLMLNPTEQCNIRCTYCYYGGLYDGNRLHQTKSASLEMTQTAIDTFLSQSENTRGGQRAVYFFGGEPLLNFSSLRLSAEYLFTSLERLNLGRDNLVVQVNSNGMLLNGEIVDFLVANDIYLNISIDGPNHDRYRVDRRGKGTHDRVRSKVEWLADKWPGYFSKRVALVCVLSDPINAVTTYNYFAGWDSARRALAWDFDLVLPGAGSSPASLDSAFQEMQKLWDLFCDSHSVPAIERDRSGRYHFAYSHGFLHKSFTQALLQEGGAGSAEVPNFLGMQTVPGNDYLMLGADGTYYAGYEYQSPEFAVGNTEKGIDPHSGIDQLSVFSDYLRATACSTCWAAKMCSLTTAELPFRINDDVEVQKTKLRSKVARCIAERRIVLDALKARQDIEFSYGQEPIDEHKADLARQMKGASDVSYFQP